MKIYPSNLNHIRFTKPTNEEIQQEYNFPCSITVLNKALSTAELFYFDGEGNEFPQGRFNIPSDYLFQKALLKTDTAPTIKGLYPLSETGVYTNLGGINAQSGKLNFASFDGTTWSKVEVVLQDDKYKNILFENERTVGNTTDVANYYDDATIGAWDYLGIKIENSKKQIIRKIHFKSNQTGSATLAIVKIVGESFTERKTIDINAAVGWNEISLDEILYEEELLLFKKPLIKLGVAANAGWIEQNNALVYVKTANPSQVIYEATNKPAVYFDVADLTFALSSIENKIFPSNNRTVGYTKKTVYYYQSTLDNWDGYGFNFDFPNGIFLKKINVDVFDVGNISFAFGIIDQWNKFIERKRITKPVVAGWNTLSFDEKLLPNEKIIMVGNLKRVGLEANGAWTSLDLIYINKSDKIVHIDPTVRLAMTYEIEDLPTLNLLEKKDLEPVEERISSLEAKKVVLTDTATGDKYTISVTNGNLVAKALGFSNILHIGNSICRHPIVAGTWWGDWGMAASIRENDYVHQFLSLVQTIKPTAVTDAINLADWEWNYETYDKTLLNSSLTGKDLVVIRIGENATYSANFKAEYKELIQYIHTQNPTATIILGGQFWTETNKENDMKAVADELGLPFVSIMHLNTPEHKWTNNVDQVYGDDNQWHTITNQGVADHPNDLAMQKISQLLFNALGI